jgi:hypothetical protein
MAARLHRTISAASRRQGGTVDDAELQRLKRLDELIALYRDPFARRWSSIAFTCVLLALGVLLALSERRVAKPLATVEVEVPGLDVAVAADQARSRSLLGSATWIRMGSWRNAALPTSCAAYSHVQEPVLGSQLTLSASPVAIVPMIGVGDDEPITGTASYTYTRGTEGSLVFEVPESELTLPIGVSQGVLSIRNTKEELSACDLTDERIELTVDRLEFLPTDVVGPIPIARIDFDEMVLSNISSDTRISAILAGSVSFPEIPSANIQLRTGDRLKLIPADASLYLQTKPNSLKAIVRGHFSTIDIGEKSHLPSMLERISDNKWLRIFTAALTAVVGLLLWLLRWLGGGKAVIPSVVLLIMLSPAIGHTQESSCEIIGSYQGDPAGFGEIAATGMIVRIRAEFKATAEIPTDRVSEGLGFVVAKVKREKIVFDKAGGVARTEDPCGSQEVQIITARHNVYEEGDRQKPARWAQEISAYLPSTDVKFDARVYKWTSAKPYKLSSTGDPPPDEYDVAVLHATVPLDFVWTGFRHAKTLKRGEALQMPRLSDSGQITFVTVLYQGIRVYPRLRLAISEPLREGDSGAPVFDKDWNVIGIASAESGMVSPADNIELLLLGHGLRPNLPRLADIRKQRRLQELEDIESNKLSALGADDGFTRAGVVRLSDDFNETLGTPMLGTRIGVYGGSPIASWRPPDVGVEFVGGWQATGGYQAKEQSIAEVGVEAGVAAYLGKHRRLLLQLTWSPSVVLFRDDHATFFFPLAAYSWSAQVGFIRLFERRFYTGLDVRSVFPFGPRESFLETSIYLAMGHD